MKGLATQKQRTGGRMLRRFALWLVVLVAGVGAGVLVYRAHHLVVALEVQSVATHIQTNAVKPLAWPEYGQSAIATPTYGVIETHGETTPHPTASTAKVITMLAVLEKKPLQRGESGPILTMKQADVESHAWYVAHNGSNTPVYTGLQLTQYQAIQAVLLASSNNMADTLALWAFGSLDAYHAYANAMVRGWGLEDTTVGGDASGLSPLTTSTASDLARIALRVLDQPVLAEIVSQAEADVPGAGVIYNTNRLLKQGNIVGLKTGETVEAGGNFMLAGTQGHGTQSQQIVVVVMGAPLASVAIDDSYKLYQSALKNFEYREVLAEGAPVARIRLPWQDEVADIIAAQSVRGWMWADRPPTVSYVSPDVIEADRMGVAPNIAGPVRVTFGGDNTGTTRSVPSRVETPVSLPPFWWRAWRAATP